MADQEGFLASSATEHLLSTPPPTMSHSVNVLPPRVEGRKNRSEAWNHFTVECESIKKASCNYCGKSIKYDNGTSAMRAHLLRCKDNPSKKQRVGSSITGSVDGEVSSSPSITKFDQEASRDELVKMFVAMEIPFRQVENEAFRRFMSVTQPSYGQAIIIKSKLASCLKSIFEEYNGGVEESQGGSQEAQLNVQADDDRYELIAQQDVACSASIALDED
ncbi:Zinc finger, BED-type [Sesbania bispinosa]|nr:Zinc finger, BED-type [Sesbania bispinosa]